MKKDKLKDPLDHVLQDMPGDYSVQYAQVLRVVNEMVLEAQKDGARAKMREDE